MATTMSKNAQEPSVMPGSAPSSLANFILGNMEFILQDWEEFAQSLFPDAALSTRMLRDHAKEILQAVAADMARPQTLEAQAEKSKGLAPEKFPALKVAAERHALDRVTEQFDLEQLIAEFRAVRGSVLRRWAVQKQGAAGHPEEITRFNESIDEALAWSVRSYARKHDEARTVILGVLAHDLRNPLHSALLSASYIIRHETINAKCIQAAARIKVSIGRCDQLVSDLIDYARSKLGQGIPMDLRVENMQGLCSAAIDEVESANPGRFITQSYSGELNGTWDSARMEQLLGNLLTNALKHGHSGTPVVLTAKGTADAVSVEIHNDGPAIPTGARASLFEPLYMKEIPGSRFPAGSSGLGLGLYICRAIARSHGGDIEVTSSEHAGTSFTLVLPRAGRPGAGAPIPA
jgi:signal transduction histidine kinase